MTGAVYAGPAHLPPGSIEKGGGGHARSTRTKKGSRVPFEPAVTFFDSVPSLMLIDEFQAEKGFLCRPGGRQDRRLSLLRGPRRPRPVSTSCRTAAVPGISCGRPPPARSDMYGNALKEKMVHGAAVGTFVNFYAPSLVEIIGYSGLDFIVIDDEHGAFSYPQIEELIRVAELAGITPLVRVSYDNSSVQKALDRGARGIHVPMVNTRADAEAAVMKARFPPLGTRGTAYSVRAARFGGLKGKEYLDAADENTIIVAHIETRQAVENFDEIVSVPGIDVAFIGPTDLSVSMGYKSEGPNHPAMRDVIEGLFLRGRRHGAVMGFLAGSAEEIVKCAGQGVRYILTVSSGLIAAKFKEIAGVAKSLNQ